ncbi:ECF RNA polymerase sigma factor SigK [Nonomuraea soli]|uniref:RNA polymerase sigma-70 factor (ECF subfamily) n=1 Tax=Nonomuraea soli TaxID=1032476 RepID=A0A7W0CGW4_9ACTN|nr:ECF RNA polymerase sigma factor SigK [Nonomuraea soli]MBA2890804.1 RNA polymerase sigma-70 factor (ECF subfamily) [Nonomuraea soli]
MTGPETRPEQAPPRATSPVPDLLARVGRGDQEAFSRLYDHIAAPLYGVVLRVVRDPSQAEEVLQEVLLEIWRLAPRYEAGRGSAMAWMTTIAHRRAVDRVRSEQASSERDVAAGHRAMAGQDYDVVIETVAGKLERERVRRCLDTLTELQRQVVTMSYYGGYSYPEVASLLTTPLGTVKTRMRDGLIRLRDCLGVEA